MTLNYLQTLALRSKLSRINLDKLELPQREVDIFQILIKRVKFEIANYRVLYDKEFSLTVNCEVCSVLTKLNAYI